MRKEKSKNNRRSPRLAVMLAMGLGLFWVSTPTWLASAQQAGTQPPPPTLSPPPSPHGEESDPMAAIEKMFKEGSSASSFAYQREGRPDPFFPFLTQHPQKGDVGSELNGMQRLEPGQLRLVAIVRTAKGLVAMVQDSAGIGYTLRRGSRIGRNGEVINIVGNKVIIRQEAFSTTKEKQYRTIEMVLTKDGDKQP